MEIPHESYDAWILYAVLLTGRPGEYATLESIVAASDFINHAIPTAGEIDGALDRLLRAGWVVQSGLAFAPTEAAEDMFSSRRGRRTAVPADLEHVRKQIGAAEWRPTDRLPPVPEKFAVQGLTADAIREACASYTSKFDV